MVIRGRSQRKYGEGHLRKTKSHRIIAPCGILPCRTIRVDRRSLHYQLGSTWTWASTEMYLLSAEAEIPSAMVCNDDRKQPSHSLRTSQLPSPPDLTTVPTPLSKSSNSPGFFLFLPPLSHPYLSPRLCITCFLFSTILYFQASFLSIFINNPAEALSAAPLSWA